MFITKIAKRLHRGEKGFTLIELLVVLAILAVIVGLVVPNFFGIMDGADAVQIQGQHEKMREAVFLYHEDTGEWPTEYSRYDFTYPWKHQLWLDNGVANWDGPYIDRPILQDNRWGGCTWGVHEDRRLNVAGKDNSGADMYTVLLYNEVPLEVAEDIDEAMDDGVRYTGAVQFGGIGWPNGHSESGGTADDANFLEIIIARQ